MEYDASAYLANDLAGGPSVSLINESTSTPHSRRLGCYAKLHSRATVQAGEEDRKNGRKNQGYKVSASPHRGSSCARPQTEAPRFDISNGRPLANKGNFHKKEDAHVGAESDVEYAMNTTDQLTAQLNQLSNSLKSTNALITRLATLRFQPGSEPLEDEDSNSVRVELAQDIHESLKQLEEELELLKQEADDLSSGSTGGTSYRRRESTNDRDHDRARVNAQVVRLGEDLRGSRSQFRRAQLSAKKAAEAAKQLEREKIFADLQKPPPDPTASEESPQADGRNRLFAARRPQQNLKEQTEVDASASVTTALRRTHILLETELSRSQFARETLEQGTAALEDLGEKYDSLDSILKGSRELLSTLVRSQKSDTWYLETAVYILATTLVWLFFRRILLGPFVRLPLFLLNWFIWKPLYLFLTLTGVITSGNAAAGATTQSRPRTSLIVQPSAANQGDIPQFDANMAEKMRQRGGVPVGAGGSNAKVVKGGHKVLDGDMSEQIGKMAEEGKESVRRADGTVLEDRGDIPKNPRKKVFEADVEDAKYEEQRRIEKVNDEGKDEL